LRRVGIDIPKIEVRFENLSVEGDAFVANRALPTLFNALLNAMEVIKECVEAEAWLREKQQEEDSLPKYANPVLLSADVKRKVEALDRFFRPVMTKPKPAAPKPPTPAESPSPPPQSTAEPQTDGADVDESAGEGEFAAGELMDTDKSGTAPSPA
ncbi:hypothetical protein MKW98_007836, partial [Papaver atlanticum]